MRQGPNPKRHRGGRPNGRRQSHGLSSNFESNGPDVKIRGNAAQVYDRYQVLARDALAIGDRVAAENYLQHAEHYQRIINAHLAAMAQSDANGGGRQQAGREQREGRGTPPDDGSENGPQGERGNPRQAGRGRGRGRRGSGEPQAAGEGEGQGQDNGPDSSEAATA